MVLRFTITTEENLPKDLTDATIKWGLWSEYYRETVVTKTTGDGITISDALAGTCVVRLDPSDTLTLPLGEYSHKCEVTDADGQVSTVLEGKVTMNQSRI